MVLKLFLEGRLGLSVHDYTEAELADRPRHTTKIRKQYPKEKN